MTATFYLGLLLVAETPKIWDRFSYNTQMLEIDWKVMNFKQNYKLGFLK